MPIQISEKLAPIRKGLLEFAILKIIATDKVYAADMLNLLSEGYEALRSYLERADARLPANPDRAEIMADLEQAIAEKCGRYLRASKTVVTVAEIDTIIGEMGPLESGDAAAEARMSAGGADGAATGAGAGAGNDALADTDAGAGGVGRDTGAAFGAGAGASASAGARHAGASTGSATGANTGESGAAKDTRQRLYQIREGAMISGVCNGLAAFLDVDVTVVRLLPSLWENRQTSFVEVARQALL